MTALRAALVAAALLALPASAHAGTVSQNGGTISYQASQSADRVDVGTGPDAFVISEPGGTSVGGGSCMKTDENRVDCTGSVSSFVVALIGDNNAADGRQVTNSATLTVQGSPGFDQLDGTPNGDSFTGGDGDDNLYGYAGNDTLDGGAGANTFNDGDGDDVIVGGPHNDTWNVGLGRDVFTPGDGTDAVSYGGRTAAVTITLNGVADDGQAGEGDNVGADVEDATGGAGNDTIVGNDLGDRLHGGAGDDSIVGGAAEDRLEGEEGNDTIDARDGRYDSIDCGPGNDVVFADPGDSTEGCEVAPDVDGDGWLPPADCDPTNPAVHPGAGEIVGNNIDEDCKDGPLYLRVVSPISYNTESRGTSVRFTRLIVREVQAGDRIEVRCATKKRGCPFTRKSTTGKAGRRTVNLLSLFKNRFLKRRAVVELRVLRANQIGRVVRLTVARGKLKSQLLCMNVGATTPTRCA